LPPAFNHLALCCRKPSADKAGQHPAAEAMAEDKQFLVGAVPAAGEQLCAPLLGTEAHRRVPAACHDARSISVAVASVALCPWPVDGRLKKIRPGRNFL
jgi:hypothetical protein